MRGHPFPKNSLSRQRNTIANIRDSLVFNKNILLLILILIIATDGYKDMDEEDICIKGKIISDVFSECIPLSGNKILWKLESDDGLYVIHNVTLPSDVIQDLMDAGHIGHPYYELNFLLQKETWIGTKGLESMITPDYIVPHMTPRSRQWIYSTRLKINLTTHFPSMSIASMDRALDVHVLGGLYPSFVLVVQGIKMGAEIRIHDTHVGTTTNQFRRYFFPIAPHILSSLYAQRADMLTLDISVNFDPNIPTHGRYMAASGGWDWAPYSKTCGQQEPDSSVFSFGIIKPMFILPVHDILVTDFAAKIYHIGKLPTQPMIQGSEVDFQVVVDIYLSHIPNLNNRNSKANVTEPTNGEILLQASFLSSSKDTIIIPVTGTAPTIRYSIIVSKDDIELWWPARMGKQTLYDIKISYRNTMTGVQSHWIKKKVGFRTLALVTYNEYDDQRTIDPNEEGSGSHGMYFRINGAIVWCRGANLVPTHQLISDDDSYILLAHSAVDAGMNMMRIWGGGEIPPDSFYDVADERGLLIFHDLMFVDEQGHGATKTLDIMLEIRDLVRRLSSHPSIVLWNGCNECKRNATIFSDVYSTFVMRIVSDEDDTRPIWPNSPSQVGWKTGIYKVDGRPNGRELTYDHNPNNISLETHGPYGHGWSDQFSTVNGFINEKEKHPPILINITRTDIGPEFKNTFVSEFGVSTLSSFESMSAFLDEEHWGVHGGAAPDKCVHIYEELNDCTGGNSFAQRNYPCDNHIHNYFGQIDLRAVGREAFQKQLYLCMIAQLLWTKSVIETYRSTVNSYGTMIWQMNENWPTGGWGLIEYGGRPNERGQVLGGRWKPIMHFLKQGLFQDLFVVCGKMGRCFIRNDGLSSFCGRISIESWLLSTGDTRLLMNLHVNVKGSGGYEYFNLTSSEFGRYCDSKNILMISLQQNGTLFIEEYPILCEAPKALVGLNNGDISISSIKVTNESIVEISLSSRVTALFVTLTSSSPGRFDRNSFALRPNIPKTVRFLPLGHPSNMLHDFDKDSFRVEHLGMYM